MENTNIDELKEKCQKQISVLESEIEELEQQLNHCEHAALGKTNLDAELMKNSEVISRLANEKSADEVKNEIEAIQEKIALMAEITGVVVNEANWKIISEEGSVIIRQHTVEGSLYTTPFILQFTVKEDFASSDSAPELSELVCMIDDNVVKFLESHLDRIVEDTEIQGFFIIMTSYMEWFAEKEKIFQSLIDKYPTIVRREGDLKNVLKIQNEGKCSPAFILTWGVKISSCFTVERNVTLTVKATDQMIELDKDKTLASAPDMFDLMVTKLGIEKAVRNLVLLVLGFDSV